MSRNLHQQDFRKTKFTPKISLNLAKFKLQQNYVFKKVYFNSAVFNITLYTTATQ